MQTAATVEKAIDLLFHLHAGERPAGVTEIGRVLGIPKSSAHRLLTALGRKGLVERDGRGRYRPGIALVALGLGVRDREPVVAAARGVLEEEAESLGETLFLAAARAGRIHVLDKAEGRGFLRAAPALGSTVPAHATAVGKLYLALAPEELRRGEPQEKFTPRTRVGRALEREIEVVRARGWAENREEWTPGLAAVAAPILAGGRLVATVALAAPSARLRAAEVPAHARRVIAAARRIAQRLEGRGE
jgi:DNA-binding IclR family transcriptional regulator